MRPAVPVLAIDGPSGSGKGTVARSLAAALGWHLLDSGALYRVVGLAAQRHGVALIEGADSGDDPAGTARRVATLAAGLDVVFSSSPADERIVLEGEDVTSAVRTESAGEAASRVAALPAVRSALLQRQRGFAVPPGLVADGRDMGTVVFPQAVLKVFLTASAEERARRRHKQLKEKGIDVSLRDLSWEIAQRDGRDERRTVAPLRPADDARVLDSTDMTPAQVVARILEWLEAAGIHREGV
jgi:CMP/dCMP kinase